MIDLKVLPDNTEKPPVSFDFYVVSLKRGCNKLIYGQQKYDFDEGLMAFMAPGQVLRGEENTVPEKLEGWMLFIHPDFLWNTSLASKIRKFEFFSNAVNEALFLSDKEETRKQNNHIVLNHFEAVLSDYFNDEVRLLAGIITVQEIAEALHMSSKYLSSLLKQYTGLTTQQHIHEKLIEISKQKLSTTELSISEIAYSLGFEHPQSFSKLFKSKTNTSPVEFRSSIN